MKKYLFVLLNLVLVLFINETRLIAQEAVCTGMKEMNIESLWLSTIEEDAIILDVREPGEVESGHLPGSVNVDIRSGEFMKRLHELNLYLDQPVYVHCRTKVRSRMAVDSLLDAGFERVIWLKGGIEAWQQANREIVTGPAYPKR